MMEYFPRVQYTDYRVPDRGRRSNASGRVWVLGRGVNDTGPDRGSPEFHRCPAWGRPWMRGMVCCGIAPAALNELVTPIRVSPVLPRTDVPAY